MPPVTWADEIEATDEDRKLLGELEQALAGWAPQRADEFVKAYGIFGLEVRSGLRQGAGFVAKAAVVVRTAYVRSAITAAAEVSTVHPEWIKGGEMTKRGADAGPHPRDENKGVS